MGTDITNKNIYSMTIIEIQIWIPKIRLETKTTNLHSKDPIITENQSFELMQNNIQKEIT